MKKEKKSLSSILLKRCPVCGKMNVAINNSCDKCGYNFNASKKETIKPEIKENVEVKKEVEKVIEEKPVENKYTYNFFSKPESLVTCKRCGNKVDSTAKFCMNCGEKIEREYFCISCNKKIEEGMLFCPFCGSKQEKPLTKVEKLNETPVENIKIEKPVINNKKTDKPEIGLEKPNKKKNNKKFDSKKILFGIIELIMILSLISMLLFVPAFLKENLFNLIKDDNNNYFYNGIEYIKTLFSFDIESIKNNLFTDSNLISSNFISYLVFYSYSLVFVLFIYRIIVVLFNMFNKKEYRYFSLLIICFVLFVISIVSYITLLILKVSSIDVLFIYIFIFEFILLLFINYIFNKKID